MENKMREKLHLLQSSMTEHIKAKQKIIFFGGFTVLTVLVVGIVAVKSYASTKDKSEDQKTSLPLEKRIKIESGGSALNPQEIWVDRLEKEQALLSKRFEQMERLLTGIAKEKLGQVQKADFPTDRQVLPGTTTDSETSVSHNSLDPSSVNALPNSFGMSPNALTKGGVEKNEKEIRISQNSSDIEKATTPIKMQRITFSLDPLSSKKIKKSIDHYVPAGSFARGRLTSGVVAATTVQASGNPQPIHIELTNLGNLPRGFKTDVKQCFLIGSAYGDLSSERVLMRLETLSCVERKTQEIIEMNVDGFVTGEDGANGLRGILVDRSGPAMRNAFVGGFISGVGGFFGQQQTSVPTMISPGGVSSFNPLSAQQMLQGGAGKGVGNAMEKLSDFYIKRAEQLQPVLEVEPGRLVHVVFKKGFDMNQTVYRQAIMNANDGERRDIADKAGSNAHNDPHL